MWRIFEINKKFHGAYNRAEKMSLTIDQQRQRVEQEMTRMVDDLDRTVLRKMQVIWRTEVMKYLPTPYRNIK